MTVIPNYELIQKLAESRQAAVYKAYHKRDPGRTLALKVLTAPLLSDDKKSRFKQRIEHLRVLNDPRVITPLAFDAKDGICFLTQDYFEGVPLDALPHAPARTPLAEFFAVACGLAGALDAVHEAGIIHGGIKPHNILVHPRTLEIRLIDFISSIDVRDISHFIYDRSFVRDTLSYTSPEQTGRINHRVVFSSDLYSLGIVLYEMLTGRLPFFSDDPLELIHSHLAQEAPAVHQRNPAVPSALSAIIAKLLRKEPEKRYQSSQGLLADLVRCRDEYASTGRILEFPLESGGVHAQKVTFISKMVGRDAEAALILEEYAQVAQGRFRSVFISGLSGIGKTRLIQELQRPIVKHRGYFTSGKFDVYQRNIPYSSLIQAFRNLMRTFLTESDERVALWKERISKAVGRNGRVLTDVIPELEVLLGPQPAVQRLPPVESLNRFHDLFGRFLSCLASPENPLTLFMDDLQWCDSASFDFLGNIFANYPEHPYLLFLGAYRHNEVDSSHPLCKLLQSARDGRLPLQEIRLGPLQPARCHEMVSYILDSPLAQTTALSSFISTLSEGNPLFVSESLSYLHNERLLFLDEERQWRWDMDRVGRSRMPTTVAALFSSKIRRLPPDLIALLEYCACMGNTFSSAELALIRGLTLLETFEILKPALGLGLLIENKHRLQFVHDKVQEAALSAIPPERRRQIHWQVGRHLLDAALEDGADLETLDSLFTIVSHLNLGRAPSLDARTAYLLSNLNYHAGNKALDALATEAANRFFGLSRALLPDDCWEGDHYERTFRIFQKAAKTELMCGNYANSERLLERLLDHAQSDLDKAECLAEQTTSLSSIGNFDKAIETANRGLAFFDKAIPPDPESADRRRAALMAEIAAKETDVWGTILNMAFTQDRRSKIELAFYSELIPDLYMSGRVPQLYLSAAQSTQHCLAGGMDESVIYSFSIMGLQLGEQGDFAQAFRYEDLARDLSAKHPNTFGATRGMNGIVWCTMHSRSHPRDIVEYCRKAIQCGKNCGDLYNAGLSYGPLMWNLQVQGRDLSAVEDCARECLQFSTRYHLAFSVGLAQAMQAGWIAPMRQDEAPAPMDATLRQWERDRHIASAGSYYVHRALAHYYLGEHAQADDCLARVRRYLSGLTDNVLQRQWHVFLALNALAVAGDGGGGRSRDDVLAEVQPLVRKVEAWARLGPLLKPYLAFLQAELERVTGALPVSRYLEAIHAAHEQEYTFLEGHVNERLGELLRQAGQCSAEVFLVQAARLYRRCRAERKEVRLLEKYPEYFEEEQRPSPRSGEAPPSASTLPNLDVNYLMKSSFAISAEIEHDALLKEIMSVVIESSGAQRGYLLVDERGTLLVRAESRVADTRSARTLTQDLEASDGICSAIVRYVHRTGEKIVSRSACGECTLRGSPDCRDMGLRSLLCLPVTKQSKRVGVLYLENRLAEGVFTPEKTKMTELLTSQAAISLENARLVHDMKAAEDRVTRSLREKEVLLKEIHHRVKNNLQIIHSLLNLQLPQIQDEQAVALFKESQNRIYSMALIHEKLYESESLARIDLAEYIRGLATNLLRSYGATERTVRLAVRVEDVALNIDTVIPCALIITELVANSLKHAFPRASRRDGVGGEIEIALRPDGNSECRLTVRDNGVGMPKDFALQRCESLGLKLVGVLVRQLRGSMHLDTSAGTEFTITFEARR